MREKSLTPQGETTDMMPFESFGSADHDPGERGYRAVVTVGQLDTDVQGLTPLDDRYELVGASSDLSVVNVGENPEGLTVGDTIRFRPSYGAMVRLMLSKYIDKRLMPSLNEFRAEIDDQGSIELPPVLDGLDD